MKHTLWRERHNPLDFRYDRDRDRRRVEELARLAEERWGYDDAHAIVRATIFEQRHQAPRIIRVLEARLNDSQPSEREPAALPRADVQAELDAWFTADADARQAERIRHDEDVRRRVALHDAMARKLGL